MSTSEQLEREAERNRTNVAATLVELRERLRPGQLTDDVLSYAGGQTGQLLNTFGKQIANNPVPALLIGAGIAWLLASNRQPSRGDGLATDYGTAYPRTGTGPGAFARAKDAMGDAASATYASAKGAAQSVGDTISDGARTAAQTASNIGTGAAELARDTARSAIDAAKSAARSAAGAARDAAQTASDAALRAGDSAVATARQAADATTQKAEDIWMYLKDQPLLLMGIGLAVGSLIGTALPRTELEDRLAGNASDRLKKKAEEALGEGASAAREVGEKTLDAAAQEAKAQLGANAREQSGATAYGSGSERGELHEQQSDQSRPYADRDTSGSGGRG